MDTDIEEDCASSSYSDCSEVRRSLLEIAKGRPTTHVAKAIFAYNEAPSLSTLLILLEEVSKNTDFSTDLRLSLDYYMDEFLRLVSGATVPRRSIIAAAGNVLQYCSKIYGDRVELMYQVVEHQIEALLIADPKKDENINRSGSRGASKPEEPRKRRTKKLTKNEFDPFAYKMEPRRLKIMPGEKRYSYAGFEKNKNRNRTIEHMYQDHTPSKLWQHSPILDADNPYEQDEKKNYKMFTYLPEPRYNTLLPDIPFERLKLIREFVHTNQVDELDALNENMTQKEYLDGCIALENNMLASRYGEATRNLLKRPLDDHEDPQVKKIRLEQKLVLKNISKRMLESTEESAKKKVRLNVSEDFDDRDMDMDMEENNEPQAQTSADTALGEALGNLTLADASQIEDPGLSSTLAMNDASCLNSTRLDKANDSNEQELLIDSGICMDDTNHTLPRAQSSDDEGVVLTDIMDEQRLKSLSPKVLVQDILLGVPDKAKLSVCVDAEMLALNGIYEVLEEIVSVPRATHYPIERNILQLPQKRLRKDCIFKLPKEFDLFKQARLPSKRKDEPKKPAASKPMAVPSPTHSVSSLDYYPVLPEGQLEFDSELNFLGFRRPTYDSGIDHEELRAESANLPVDDHITLEVGIEDKPLDPNAIDTMDTAQTAEIPQARALDPTETGFTLNEEMSLGAIALDTTPLHANESNDAVLRDTTALHVNESNDALQPFTTALEATQEDSGLNGTEMDLGADWDAYERNLNITKTSSSIDVEIEAKVFDWHRRLAPTLEAAHARQNFNIEDLNDEIIQKCQAGGGEATLADVVADKDPTKLCCYMLSSLMLANHGNVSLKIDKSDKSKPVELRQFQMHLISTERKNLNPEDDIGNLYNVPQPKINDKTRTVKVARPKVPNTDTDDMFEPINVNQMVRLIKPVPKASARPEDADSGISSLSASLASDLFAGT